MKNLWIILLIVVVAAGAFFLGRRTGEPVPAMTNPTAAASPASQPTAATLSKTDHPKEHGTNIPPVRTFRGPDGRAHIISYDDKNPPDSKDPAQVRTALLSDMKYFPINIVHSYDLSAEDVKAIVAGSKPIPDYMLPAAAAPASGK